MSKLTKAERWLRVGEALETGKLEMGLKARTLPYWADRFWADYDGRTEYGPDPLTAAERALGIVDTAPPNRPRP